MTRTLITNDDGIDAPGLAVLARAAVAHGLEVTVAAPERQSSGTSASIVAGEEGGRIAVDRRRLDGLEDVPAFAVRGGPGLIALIAAHGAFGDPPDLVLSGVNHGANVGRAILHSGTVGAALTGGLNGARALAVSLDVGMHPTSFAWETAAGVAMTLLPFLSRLEEGAVLNLNVPNTDAPRGIREAPLAPFGIVQTTLSERGVGHIRLAVEDLPNEPLPGTDAALLAEGWATLTGIEPVSHRPVGYETAESAGDDEGRPTP
ncbi:MULTISPECIES: 5'/3'-nucleotidase SurE [Microbacterium]|uniref:5'/3'-nucleotidase SurE n=1 Tax=Microbacterium TaxID=33882 RepID=UPI00217D4AAA|nr:MULTISPECIES: 5'/3'-nucleotidase SurE [Microbacterium]UWF78332.1 5'/3'-nucleotidase SurE [Microbacterium neungamense]WCM56509.1 5'/3'-nucleotidase SurE [Microbacterium sp. EF45047]